MLHATVVGRIAPRSQPPAMYIGGTAVQPTRTPIVLTPLGRDVQALCDAIADGEVKVYSPHDQERIGCDEWHHYWQGETRRANPDPHGDLSELQSMEIPF